MKLFKHSIQTKGLKNFLKRFFTIAKRFGITPRKYTSYFDLFITLQEEFSFKTTFPMTASVIKNHSSHMKRFLSRFHLLPHGLYHVDYSKLEKETVEKHLDEGKTIFSELGIGQNIGFRAPYLRYSDTVRNALRDQHFLFDSSKTIFVQTKDLLIEKSDKEILENLYHPVPFEKKLSLPYNDRGIIEVPVTLPDDEITIDRLGIKDDKRLGQIFLSVADTIYDHEEAFIMQVHPERIRFLLDPLRNLLKELSKKKNIWTTDILSLVQWFSKASSAKYRIDEKNGKILYNNTSNRKITGNHVFFRSAGDEIFYTCDRIPVIFASHGVDKQFVDALETDGFFITRSLTLASRCAWILDPEQPFSAERYRKLLKEIKSSEAPLLSLSRWPEGKNGAFCLSGDIDALTILDFFSRMWHFSGEK